MVSFSSFIGVSLTVFYGWWVVRVVGALRSWLLWASAGQIGEEHWAGLRASRARWCPSDADGTISLSAFCLWLSVCTSAKTRHGCQLLLEALSEAWWQVLSFFLEARAEPSYSSIQHSAVSWALQHPPISAEAGVSLGGHVSCLLGGKGVLPGLQKCPVWESAD